MEIKYIDIHSHLGFEDYGEDQKEVIKRMQEAGVATIVVGADLASSKEAVKVATENENVWACIGMHPNHNVVEVFDEKEYEELVKNPKVVAVGECGLDYHIAPDLSLRGNPKQTRPDSLDCFTSFAMTEKKQKQKDDFIKQIELAIKYKKPLMLHIRDAHDDAYEILKKYEGKVFGNLHFFTSTLENANRFIALGFTISFPGIITYVKDLDTIVKSIPLEMMHAETDSPFASPVPYRGKRNEPSYVIEVYKKIAEIRGEDFEVVRQQLLNNARRLFDISFV